MTRSYTVLIKKWLFPFLLLTVLPVVFQGCKAAKEILKQGGVQKPSVEVINADIQNFSILSADFVFDLKITNPNAVGVDLSGFDYNLLINQKSFLKGEQNTPMTIEPNQSSVIHLPLTVDFADIFSVFSDLATKSKASYQLTTGFHFDIPLLGKVRVPATKSGEFKLR